MAWTKFKKTSPPSRSTKDDIPNPQLGLTVRENHNDMVTPDESEKNDGKAQDDDEKYPSRKIALPIVFAVCLAVFLASLVSPGTLHATQQTLG